MTLHPDITVFKGQKKLLDACGDQKSFLYNLMEMLWSKEVMATHSLTGKASNAHRDKEPKPSLDGNKVKALFGKLLI